jgi:hypothetical protein
LLFKVQIVKNNCDWTQKNLLENVKFPVKQIHEDFPLQKYLTVFLFIKIYNTRLRNGTENKAFIKCERDVQYYTIHTG